MDNTSRVLEPTLAQYENPIKRYFSATRPTFLTATLAARLLGQAGAISSGVKFKAVIALCTVLLALLVHAAVNVLNDYFDALNGTDAINTGRLFPFTGGSRFIQNGLVTAKQTAYFGYMLLFIAMTGGLLLVWHVGSGLLAIGTVGIFVGWAYSAALFRLNGRGLGEMCVLLGFLGIVMGADFALRRVFSCQSMIVGMPFALLVTNLLYINQFPDIKADTIVGKRTLVVRLGATQAVWVYLALASIAFIWLLAMVKGAVLPLMAMLSVLPLRLSLRAFWLLRKFAAKPAQLLSAIQLTLAAMLGHALLLILILLWNRL